MAGEIKLNDVSIATESGGTVTLGNATLGSTVVLGTNASPIASNLVLAAGNGIDFSAASGSAAGSSSAVLDDYEEGTWIPTYFFSGGGTVPLTANDGTYVKVGNLVHCSFRIRSTTTVSGISGDLYIGGFPFTAVSNSRSAGSKWFARSWSSDMPNFSFGIQAGTTQATVYKHAMNSSTSTVGTSDFSTGSDSNVLEASITYRVA
jgi:hypothetical protein